MFTLLKFLSKLTIILSLKKTDSGLKTIIHLHRDFNKLNIKYQSYIKPTKIDAFERKICICHKLTTLADEFAAW